MARQNRNKNTCIELYPTGVQCIQTTAYTVILVFCAHNEVTVNPQAHNDGISMQSNRREDLHEGASARLDPRLSISGASTCEEVVWALRRSFHRTQPLPAGEALISGIPGARYRRDLSPQPPFASESTKDLIKSVISVVIR